MSDLKGFIERDGEGVTPLRPGRTTLGRSPQADIVIPDRAVSRFHAVIERTAQGFQLADLSSRNGTFLNGVRIAPDGEHYLGDGDEIRLGRASPPLYVRIPHATPAGPPEEKQPEGAPLRRRLLRDETGEWEDGQVRFMDLGIGEDAARTLAARFTPVEVVSSGGMGAIILAQERLSRRFVALKIMLERYVASTKHVEQFAREAIITARLQHPYIIPVYDLGFFQDNQPYYTMRYVEGATFDRRLPELSLPQRLRVLQCAAEAVDYAHAQGLWHRDLKPHNVMIGRYGDVYVIDWGLVSVQPGKRYELAIPQFALGKEVFVLKDHLLPATRQALTTGSGTYGTPAYMPPEQLRGKFDDMGVVSDVWAFGVMLFMSLVGRHPVEVGHKVHGPMDIASAVLTGKPLPRPKEVDPGVPAVLDQLCAHMLRHDRRGRMQSLTPFIREVKSYLKEEGYTSLT